MKVSRTSSISFLEEQMELDKVLPYIRTSLEFNETDAKWLLRNMTIFVYGMASMCITGTCLMVKEDIAGG